MTGPRDGAGESSGFAMSGVVLQMLLPKLKPGPRPGGVARAVGLQAGGNYPDLVNAMIKNHEAVIKTSLAIRQLQIVDRRSRKFRLHEILQIVSPKTEASSRAEKAGQFLPAIHIAPSAHRAPARDCRNAPDAGRPIRSASQKIGSSEMAALLRMNTAPAAASNVPLRNSTIPSFAPQRRHERFRRVRGWDALQDGTHNTASQPSVRGITSGGPTFRI